MGSTSLPVPDIDDVTLVFPANALEWMPAMEDIPQEFKQGDTEWNAIASAWFYRGLPADVKFYPRKGVDAEKAVRAAKATLGSYAPSHQYKEAAVAYMLCSWFTKIKNWKQPPAKKGVT